MLTAREIQSEEAQCALVMKAVRSFTSTSSPGPASLSFTLLKDWLENSAVSQSVYTRYIMDICAGQGEQVDKAMVTGASVSAFAKNDGGIRPIACGGSARRVAAKVVLLLMKTCPIYKELQDNGQMGAGASKGLETIVHKVKGLLGEAGGINKAVEKNGAGTKVDMAMLMTDWKNAFNSTNRKVALALVLKHVPWAHAFVSYCYEEPSTLLFDKKTVIPSEEGVQQGDPLGPLLFSLVLNELTQKLPASLAANLWYLDDGHLVGGKGSLREAWALLISPEAKALGLHLQPPKCQLALAEGGEELEELAQEFGIPDSRIRRDGNFMVLGSPVGSPEYCAAQILAGAGRKNEAGLAAIEQLTDPQAKTHLMVACTGTCRVIHLARTSPPSDQVQKALDMTLWTSADFFLSIACNR